jgi:hypothetical protein
VVHIGWCWSSTEAPFLFELKLVLHLIQRDHMATLPRI